MRRRTVKYQANEFSIVRSNREGVLYEGHTMDMTILLGIVEYLYQVCLYGRTNQGGTLLYYIQALK